MARSIRIEYTDAIYHVTSRGNAQADIYLDDSDRLLFLETFAQVVQRFGWLCHGYCLMDNHYHLLIQTPQANLSKGMRHLNGVYTQRFNRKHRRVGHVFQGRYKAIVVERDSYLLELCRYIVRNPVAAHMVEQVGDWSWSSYQATAGLKTPPPWLYVDWILSQFGSTSGECRAHYKKFVADGVGQKSVWEGLSQQIYLGADDFIDQVKSNLTVDRDLSEIPKMQWKPAAKPLQAYEAETDRRHEAMAMAYLEGGYSMKVIADHFGVHYATVSRAVKKWDKMYDCKT
ncbi:MAG: transposase [Ghiorsea sp.]|nr:transposase [Ghiorsea sp.]MDQ7057192.1 transposase [Ghiorsea sp.]